MVAASCDALRTVSVWSVPAGQLLWRFSENFSPVLPLRFASDSVLVYAEQFRSIVHVVDLRWVGGLGGGSVQLLGRGAFEGD